MGVYVDSATVNGRGRAAPVYVARLYYQPLVDHLRSELYHHFWERPTWRLVRLVESHFMRRHERTCDGCTTGVDGEGQRVRICGYIPLGPRQDIRCFDLKAKNAQEIAEVEISPVEYARICRAQGYRVPEIKTLRRDMEARTSRKKYLSRRAKERPGG